MKLSPAELSYIKDSLTTASPVRPDSRSIGQFRPVEASTDFSPLTNGSSRVVASDGAECIMGVKASVIRKSKLIDLSAQNSNSSHLVKVSVDISGLRDDDFLVCQLIDIFESTLNSSKALKDALNISSTYTFQLFIDAVILAHTSHPIGMLSFAVYLALQSARLPKLESSVDDSKAEEVPQFNDDWDSAIPLFPSNTSPPIIVYMAAVGKNVIVDPTEVEEQVASAGILVGWSDGQVRAPITNISLSTASSNVITREILSKAISLAGQCGKDLCSSLDHIIKLDQQDGTVY